MSKLTLFLSMVWALSLLYGEWIAFLVPSLWTCSWPHFHRPSLPSLNGVDEPTNFVKVAVIADPQLMDRTSLPLAPKSLALEIAQFYTDLNMRRAFLLSMLPFNPELPGHWQDSLSRFKHIFNLNMVHRTSSVKVYHLSGNHDVGYAAVNSRKPDIIKRYEKEFGGRNFRVTLGKVDFIAVDAQTLDGYPQSDFTSATWNFIRNVSKDMDSTPRVLLTHIPLYRPDWSSCGPHRSSAIINQVPEVYH